MAIQPTITDTSYSGEYGATFIRQAIIGAETIDGGNVFVKDGIKSKFRIPRLVIADAIQDYALKPVSSGTTTFSASLLEPSMYELYIEFDPHSFEDYYLAPEMETLLVERSLPVTAEAALITAVLEYHNDYFDYAIWNNALTGSTPYNKFDGFIQKAKADATVLDVTTTATALTASNIFAEIEKVYKKIPAAVKRDKNTKIFMSQATFEIFADAQIAQTNKGVDTTQGGVPLYKGKQVVSLANFPDNYMVAAKGTAGLDSNLWVGVNSKDDNMVKIGRVQNNSEAMFIKVEFKADTAFGFGSEVVLYKTV